MKKLEGNYDVAYRTFVWVATSIASLVRRSAAGGLEMMRGYPDVYKYPGVLKDWLPAERWSMTRVFDDMQH
eukprot:6212322-Pleurochrysis_carterae.AAC.1